MASSEHPFPNEIPSRHPLPSGFQLTPDARSTTLPVTPVIPPTVASGDVITSLHENQTVAALGDLWTNEQWLAAQSLSDPTSAKGDLLARDASALARLAVGTAGQVLTVDAAAPLGVKWAAPAGGGAVSSVFGRTGAVVAVAGDYTVAQVTNAVATSRQVIAGAGLAGGGALTADVTLTANAMIASGASHRAGMVPDPGATVGATRYLREDATWAIPAGAGGGLTDPTTTLGDLIVRGAAAPTRLGVGTNGQALLADSAAPLGVKWGAVAAGGSQTPWTSDIHAADFNLNRVKGIGIGALQDAAANFGVFISHASIFDAFKQINSSSTGWAGFSLQNDLGSLFAFRVYGSGRTPSNVAALESSIPMTFFTGAVERMRISAAGLVGIGRTPTTYPLEVAGDVNITGTNSALVFNSVGGANHILFKNSGVDKWLVGRGPGDGSDNFNFYNQTAAGIVLRLVDAGAVAETMTLKGGNVGIGMAPVTKLDVLGPVRSTDGVIDTRLFVSGTAGIIGTISNNDLLFVSNNIERVRVRGSDGAIGIGTNAPVRSLHVAGIPLGGGMVVSGGAPNFMLSGLDTEPNTNPLSVFFGMATAAGHFALPNAGDTVFSTTGTARGDLYLSANYQGGGATRNIIMQGINGGNVGIGMVPTYKLQINTDSAAKPTTSAWTVASDARLKRNVRDLAGGLEVIKRLRPVEAEYNGLAGTPEGGRVVSFLAMEIREVLPHTVGSRRGKLSPKDKDETEILDFNIHEVLMHLVLAVKQLAAMRPSDGN